MIEALTGLKIKTKPYTRDKRAREVRRTPAGRTAGPLTGISSVAMYERNSVENLWTADGVGAVELATGGAVIEVASGAGRIIIDRLAWETSGNLAHRQWTEHYVSSLASALGVEVDLYHFTSRRQFNLKDFTAIDLRAVVNRGFRSELPGDGRGWTDQGPANDLRGMQTGRRVFHQILFDIIDPDQNQGRSCLVLRSQDHAPTGVLATEELAVGIQAHKLFFLHTAAWFNRRTHLNRALIRYVVTYEDGTSLTVEALGGQHIRDWWSPGAAEQARGVSLLLRSETEPDEAARRRGLQLQEWTNPHPDKVIRSLRIETADTGAIPIVLAVTAWREPRE
jgi:beta-galactosidase